MKSRKGFTLVELMVVVVIVALLAALLIPMLTARIEAARWSEGKAAAGTIATALRAYVIEKAELDPAGIGGGITDISEFMNPADLHGKYFEFDNFILSAVTYTPGTVADTGYVVTYLIRVNQGTAQASGGGTATQWTKLAYTLDYMGNWIDLTP